MIALLRRLLAHLLGDGRFRCERCGRVADPTIVGVLCRRHRPRALTRLGGTLYVLPGGLANHRAKEL